VNPIRPFSQFSQQRTAHVACGKPWCALGGVSNAKLCNGMVPLDNHVFPPAHHSTHECLGTRLHPRGRSPSNPDPPLKLPTSLFIVVFSFLFALSQIRQPTRPNSLAFQTLVTTCFGENPRLNRSTSAQTTSPDALPFLVLPLYHISFCQNACVAFHESRIALRSIHANVLADQSDLVSSAL
jgi:hypothetical protein